MPSHSVLRRQSREIVYNVSKFMQTEADEGIKIDIRHVQKRVAAATGVSTRTVRRIRTEANKSDLLAVFRTPGKKRLGKKRVTNIDIFDEGLLKRCVHNFHITEKELPTVRGLLRKLKEDNIFQGSASSLGRILKRLGFKWKKTEDKRKLLIEHTSIRLKRIEFLLHLTRYREEGRPIVYTDESYIDSTHISSNNSSDGSKKNFSKGHRVVIVHACSEAGFVPNALLLFKTEAKTGDSHNSNINFQKYEKWLRTQLIPNLPPRSIVVLDDASYHNKQEDLYPSSNSRKSDMQSWLREKGISFSPEMLKPQLYKLISQNKDRNKKFIVDRILAENDHTVLRLPSYHPDLNPLEIVWAAIKSFVAKKNMNWNINEVMELVLEKFDSMNESECKAMCAEVKSIEESYKKSDHIIDDLTEQFIVNDSASESETDSEDETEDSADSNHESDDDSDNDSEVLPSSSKGFS